MDRDRKNAKEQMKAQPTKTKIENFWFYYKKHVIVAIVLLAVLVSECVRCSRQIDYDLQISYYSKNVASQERIDELKEILKNNAVDINDNDSVDVEVYAYAGDIQSIDTAQDAQASMLKLQAEVAMGECPFYIMDEFYKSYIEKIDEKILDMVVDLTLISEFKEKLDLKDGESLYWVSVKPLKENSDKNSQFYNADLIEEKLFNK